MWLIVVLVGFIGFRVWAIMTAQPMPGPGITTCEISLYVVIIVLLVIYQLGGFHLVTMPVQHLR